MFGQLQISFRVKKRASETSAALKFGGRVYRHGRVQSIYFLMSLDLESIDITISLISKFVVIHYDIKTLIFIQTNIINIQHMLEKYNDFVNIS